jgi:hypothetical protein
MGWQDRDWAKLRDDELDAIYAFRKSPATRSLRALVWAALGVATLAVVGFALYERPHRKVFAVDEARSAVRFGDRGTSTAVAPTAPGGVDTVCVEKAEQADGSWLCLDAWVIDQYSPPVAEAHPYPGACTHERVDESAGRWLCVSGG